ncbi:MAG: hypothetical protein OXF60_02830 [Gammaproteobacteria bacterium]|nr:hypothetical protein [Gammaproteobacteria bacterium]
MSEWLGISHLFELSTREAIAGFFTPLGVFVVVFFLQMTLPVKKVTGYVIDSKTGRPRHYRLNGLLVYLVLLLIWAFELFGLPHDWFYRSTIYAVAGGSIFSIIFLILTVYTQPKREDSTPITDFWTGRVHEISLFNQRFDVKMYLYVVGGSMLSLNALSAAVWHYQEFGYASNPGVFIYSILFSLYILDYFIFERAMLYTFDLIHEGLGFKLFWGGLIVYGWMFTMPLWGMAALPHPDFHWQVFSTAHESYALLTDFGYTHEWTVFWLFGTAGLFVTGWSISRLTSLQKYTFKRWPERKFLGIIEPKVIDAGDRKILCSGFWGVARHFSYMGEAMLAIAVVFMFGYPNNPWAWTYTIFIICMMFLRQIDDDKFCSEKYGPENWAKYKKMVKYRIIPGIY